MIGIDHTMIHKSYISRCHNIITEESPNPDEDTTYAPDLAMVIARVMTDLNHVNGLTLAINIIVKTSL